MWWLIAALVIVYAEGVVLCYGLIQDRRLLIKRGDRWRDWARVSKRPEDDAKTLLRAHVSAFLWPVIVVGLLLIGVFWYVVEKLEDKGWRF